MQIGNPREIAFRIHDLKAGLELERELKTKFQDQRVRGEWFQVNEELEQMWDQAEEVETRKPIGRPPEKRLQAAEWLKIQLANGPMSASQIRVHGRQAGFSRKTLQRAADQIGIDRNRMLWRYEGAHDE